MAERIVDPDVRLLVAIAAALKSDYVREGLADPWAGSPFAWIRTLPSRQRGKVGEQLVAGWCAAKELDVTASGDSEADRVIAGRRVEIKFSTLWESGVYTFQQIRDQRYDYLVCLGVSPFDAHSWLIPKDVLRNHVIGHTPQHRGKQGTDTFWLSFAAAQPPRWLVPYGGSLSLVFRLLRNARRPSGRD